MIAPERIFLVDLGDEVTWCQSVDIRDGIEGVPYIRQDVFNPDWDQAAAARESLHEHMLITKKALDNEKSANDFLVTVNEEVSVIMNRSFELDDSEDSIGQELNNLRHKIILRQAFLRAGKVT